MALPRLLMITFFTLLVLVGIYFIGPRLTYEYTSTGRNATNFCVDTLNPDYINDGYCDCMEGSDEPLTGRCNDQRFVCHTGKKTIHSSFVDDRICDCCDGSDEINSDTHCSNVCQEQLESERKRIQHEIEIQVEGVKLQEIYLEEVDDFKKEFLDKAFQTIRMADQLSSTFIQERNKMMEGKTRPTEKQRHYLQQLYSEVSMTQYHAYVARKLVETDFGPHDSYTPLVGKCFSSKSISEKQLKGGSSNMVSRSYTFVFCPYHNISQTEPFHHEWLIQQDKARLGDKYNPNLENNSKRKSIEPILLGVWDPPSTEVSHPITTMSYNLGEKCLGDIHRQAHVHLSCGLKDEIVSVVEEEVCKYIVKFQTPLACSIEQADTLRNMLEKVEQDQLQDQHDSQYHKRQHDDL